MASILEKTTGLVAFVRTVDAGTFSAASRLIGSSQSAVSKSVARLEHRLGVRLIQRSTRTLSLTMEGQAYYERVAPLLRAIEDAEDVVQSATAQGPLRVSAPQELGRMLIAPWAATFLDRHPDVSLDPRDQRSLRRYHPRRLRYRHPHGIAGRQRSRQPQDRRYPLRARGITGLHLTKQRSRRS